LDSFGYQRNLAQMKIHMEMLPCVICSVFKYDTQVLREQLMNVFGITRLNKELLLIANRRNGKTTAVLMMLCAIILWYPHVKIILFSQNMDHTRELMSSLTQMLRYHPETRKMVPANPGTKILVLKNPNNPGDIRTVLGISQRSVSIVAIRINLYQDCCRSDVCALSIENGVVGDDGTWFSFSIVHILLFLVNYASSVLLLLQQAQLTVLSDILHTNPPQE